VVVDEQPAGIRELEVREPLADLRTGVVALRKTDPPRMPEGRRRIEAMVVSFYRHLRSRIVGESMILAARVSI